MLFAERIKSLRTKERYSQTQMGEMIGVRPNTIWRWENNKAKPDAETLVKIAQALNTTVAYLLGETDAPQQEHQTHNNSIATIIPQTKEQSVKVDKGMMSYHFSNGEKIELPAIPELVPIFQNMVAERLKMNNSIGG